MIELNSLPNDKILDRFKLNAYADDEINVAEKLEFVFGRVEKIVGKGENAGISIFSFSHNVFKRLLLRGDKARDYLINSKLIIISDYLRYLCIIFFNFNETESKHLAISKFFCFFFFQI